jgi:D-lactate dehydrogenase
MGSQENALKLLENAANLDFASAELKQALSQLMTLEEVAAGHIFVEEGATIERFLILEQGVLERYKLGSNSPMSALERAASFANSVLIDTVQGEGRVAGLLHNLQEDGTSFATVVAQGPAKVWTVKGADFRELVHKSGAFGLELLAALALRLREESKISRALVTTRQGMDSSSGDGSGPILKVLCYDTTSWVSNGFQPAIKAFNKMMKEEEGGQAMEIAMSFTEERLSPQSAAYAAGYKAVCTFVNDTAGAQVIRTLSILGVEMIAQRAAGFDRIDTKAAKAFGITVARVPAYSPYAVAEMAIALLMAVNRKVTRASNRVKMHNFTLDEGLMGMDIFGKTVGVMGTGKIGAILCNIILGFGAKLICFDVFENDAVKLAGGSYVTQEEIYAQSDVLFLMMPLLPPTKHTINKDMLSKLKKGVILINTSRGGLVDTKALLDGLHSGIISGVGMDVYENEQEYFFQDWSARQVQDPDLVALLGNNNVVLTAHQAFFTQEAVDKIISTTLENLRAFASGKTGLEHPNNCLPVEKK